MQQRTMIMHDKHGDEMTVAVRSALTLSSPCARYTFPLSEFVNADGTI